MNRLGSTTRDRGPVQLHAARVRVPLSAVVGAWAARRVGSALVWAARHPAAVAALAVAVLVWRAPGTRLPALALVAALGVILGVWRVAWPASFATTVAWRTRGWWRAARVYRFHWQPAMVTTGLAVVHDGTEHLPRILGVRSTGSADLVRVRMLPGQCAADWADVAGRLAQTFAVLDCRVRSVPGRPHELVLWFLVADPLADPVPPFPIPARGEDVDLAALAVAVGEDGQTWRLRLLHTHLLVVGATGSGKGSVIWSILAALAPAIRDGLVRVVSLDPKGGMELALGRRLFDRFVYGDPDSDRAAGSAAYEVEFADALEDAVAVMRRRQAQLRGISRLHVPTVAEPLVVVVVDELASLTAYVADRDAKRRIAAALALLLSQGRAVGVTVIGAVQDPRKEVVDLRDLFPTRIGLRLADASQVPLVFGPGARDAGARCDQISESLPGVGYVGQDGLREPVRVRFCHVTDDHIAHLADVYAPGRSARPAATGAGDAA